MSDTTTATTQPTDNPAQSAEPNSFTPHEDAGTNPAQTDTAQSEPTSVPSIDTLLGDSQQPTTQIVEPITASPSAEFPVQPPVEPDSTITAQASSEMKTEEPESTNTTQPESLEQEPKRPEPSVSADELKEPTSPAELEAPSPLTSLITPLSSTPEISPPSEATSSSDLGDLGNTSDLPPTSSPADTNIQPPPDQAPQVQSETPASTPNNPSEQTPPKAAETKPESPQRPQEAPMAKEESLKPPSKPVSFGDLLSGKTTSTSQPSELVTPLPSDASAKDEQAPVSTTSAPSLPSSPSIPSTSPTIPPVTFGDLLKNIKPQDISPDLFTIKHDEPIVSPPQPSSDKPSPAVVSPPSPASPAPALQPTVSTTSPPSSQLDQSDKFVQSPHQVIDQEKVEELADERIKSMLTEKRLKANQARTSRRQKALGQLKQLIQSRGKLTSREAQLLMHLPQSTLGDYFRDLVKTGAIKKFGKGRGMYYTL